MKRNFKGQNIGTLKVLSRTKPDKNGKVRWLCKCCCGNTLVVSERKLDVAGPKVCPAFLLCLDLLLSRPDRTYRVQVWCDSALKF